MRDVPLPTISDGVPAADLGARAVVCDAADPVQIQGSLEELPGRIGVLVNNAGGNTDFGQPDPDGDLAQLKDNWQANLSANLLSAVLTTAALAAEAGGEWRGRASRVDRGEPGCRLVRRGQGGARHLDLEIAAELGLRGITSNLVAPGFIAETEFFQGKLSDERRKRLLEATMTHREGELGDIAGTIFFLASSAARHITGQVLQVNGGALTSR